MTGWRLSPIHAFALLPVTVLVLADAAAAQGRRSTFEPGVSYRPSGQKSLAEYANQTAVSCRDLCIRDDRCRHWVYVTAAAPQANVRNACALYATPPVSTPIKTHARGWIVGGRVLTRGGRRRVSTYEPGVLFSRRNQTSGYSYLENTVVQRCREACLGDARCRHWSYITANGPEKVRNSCMLYDTPPVRQAVQGRYRAAVISGRISTR